MKTVTGLVRDALKQHLSFIRTLPCARCEREKPSSVFSFGGAKEMSLPMCSTCLAVPDGVYSLFSNKEEGRRLARNLWLLSGDFYSAHMALMAAQRAVFY